MSDGDKSMDEIMVDSTNDSPRDHKQQIIKPQVNTSEPEDSDEAFDDDGDDDNDSNDDLVFAPYEVANVAIQVADIQSTTRVQFGLRGISNNAVVDCSMYYHHKRELIHKIDEFKTILAAMSGTEDIVGIKTITLRFFRNGFRDKHITDITMRCVDMKNLCFTRVKQALQFKGAQLSNIRPRGDIIGDHDVIYKISGGPNTTWLGPITVGNNLHDIGIYYDKDLDPARGKHNNIAIFFAYDGSYSHNKQVDMDGLLHSSAFRDEAKDELKIKDPDIVPPPKQEPMNQVYGYGTGAWFTNRDNDSRNINAQYRAKEQGGWDPSIKEVNAWAKIDKEDKDKEVNNNNNNDHNKNK
eukprot:332114_1